MPGRRPALAKDASMPTRLAASLLLLAFVAMPALARDARQLGANGDGGCPDQAGAAADATLPAGRRAPGATDTAPRDPAATRPAASNRGGEDAVRPPRWHSFLPGMFR